MRLRSLEGNTQRLDGGAMFGNCPRALWSRWCPPDKHHRIGLACRCLLIEDQQRRILLETGIGAFFPPKLRDRFGVQESDHVLLDSLNKIGLTPDDIDVIVLSHLHFDHAGGLLNPWQPDTPHSLAFNKARFVISAEAWNRSRSPHPRDRASFIPELNDLLTRTGRVEIVEGSHSDTLGAGFSFVHSHGHTPGLLLTRVATPQGPLTFMGDLVPGTPWVHLPITMGYDRFPELLIDEKKDLLQRIESEQGWMFFTHDEQTSVAKLSIDEKGRFCATQPQAAIDWS